MKSLVFLILITATAGLAFSGYRAYRELAMAVAAVLAFTLGRCHPGDA